MSLIPQLHNRDSSDRDSSALLEMAPFRLSSWTLREVFTVMFRRKWLLLGLFGAVLALTIALSVLLPSQYTSRMRILVKNARADVVITPERTNSPNTSGEVTETQINSEIALLTSKDLLEQVVRESGLDQHAPASIWTNQVPPVERAVLQLEKDLEIIGTRKADIIEISYTARSPELAASVLQNLANLYLEKHLKLHRPPGTREFFQAQTSQYNAQLQEVEGSLESFQRQKNFISLEQEKQLNLQKMAEVRSRFLDAVGSVKDTTERIAKLQQQLIQQPDRVATQSRSLPNQYSLERLSTMLVELKNKRTQLLTKYRPDDRLVTEVDQQIKDTTQALEESKTATNVEQSSDINPLRQTLETELAKARQELAGELARRDDLKGQVEKYTAVLARLEQATKEHGDLERQVNEAEENYQLYAKKREEARIADELDQKKITNVSLAETPVVQRAPSKPNRRLMLALGLFMAAFVSMSAVILAELVRDTVHTPRELETLAGVPVIATLREGSATAV
ncbi:MAG TPA: Wzz/FepE/Etk N-terminal domain-containing protein [Pyrinomonadaceae bacterium]|nr:Wzz/FepE/Etk N-terminal domain-containing protein [Pyrinomonadaceae bacterium]